MTGPIDTLAARLRPHYSRFLASVGDGVLLTGHSHQAWPDVSRQGQLQAWDDAAALIDGKWGHVLTDVLDRFREGVARRIGSNRPGDLAIASNTHELGYRLLSCFGPAPSVLTTDSEFHSLSRQLARLEEAASHVVRLPADAPDFAAQLIAALDERKPDLLALSYVLFTNARVVTDLQSILHAAAERDVPVLVDAYHAFNTLPLDVDTWPGTVFVVGGGYKYAQSGEGVCWMLVPEDATRFRPVYTGWFADFGSLESGSARVGYGPGGARFMGATFDPTGLYRAVAVMDWMDETGLDVPTLRSQSELQTALIIEEYDRLALGDRGIGLATPRDPQARAAFVAFEHRDAVSFAGKLADNGVRVDARKSFLRLGPAPYTTTAEIERGVQAILDLI